MPSNKKELGDFQTPLKLARQVCDRLVKLGISPATLIEPTCGKGSFIIAALEYFPRVEQIFGVDINNEHLQFLKQELNSHHLADKVEIRHDNFFDTNWKNIFATFSDPLLIIGNPPWVTNSTLGLLNSHNLPAKNNFQNLSGLDALTGKSNFDISEWMLLHLLQLSSGRNGVVAMLVKTSVARKVLNHCWRKNIIIGPANLYLLDGKQEFGVSVEMGLFVCHTHSADNNQICQVYNDLSAEIPATTFGFNHGQLVANTNNHNKWKHLASTRQEQYQWRSGIKHDVAKVMELTHYATFYKNNLNESCILENDYVYPLLKSSDLAKGSIAYPHRWLLVPQTFIGESTEPIKQKAPQTWNYLNNHKSFFDQRKSSIYHNKPDFSVFGVGAYSFAPWKVAISGLYKQLKFVGVGPLQGKPVMLDDTCYFIPCATQEETDFLVELLNSSIAQEFFNSFIFWDAKRPITANILNQLNIFSLAQELGVETEIKALATPQKITQIPLW